MIITPLNEGLPVQDSSWNTDLHDPFGLLYRNRGSLNWQFSLMPLSSQDLLPQKPSEIGSDRSVSSSKAGVLGIVFN